MAELDIGVMVTPRPQPNMQANASTAGCNPSAAGSGTTAPTSATIATGLSPSCPVAISSSGISSGTVSGGSVRDQRREARARQQIADGNAHETGGTEHGRLGADGWYAQQEALGPASQQSGQTVSRRTRRSARIAR